MKYSFITPIYNTDVKLVKRSILSIKKLQLSNYEIILVNDGSTETAINTYCEDVLAHDNHVLYIKQHNQGSAVARNKGLEVATGDYIVFVDADDNIVDNFSFKDYPVDYDIVCYGYNWVSEKKEKSVSAKDKEVDITKIKGDVISNILYDPNVLRPYDFGTIWAKRFSKKFLDENKIRFHSELRKTQDRIFMLEAMNAASKVFYSNVSMYNYYQNANSITHKINFKIIDYYVTLMGVFQKVMQENNIEADRGKYFAYSVFIETLPLTYFHSECTLTTREKKRGFNKLYSLYKLDDDLSNLKLSDFNTLKQKVKFLLIKYRMFYTLKKLMSITNR